MQCYMVLWISNNLIEYVIFNIINNVIFLYLVSLSDPPSCLTVWCGGDCVSRISVTWLAFTQDISYNMTVLLDSFSSQQVQPPHPSNILEVSPSPLWREKNNNKSSQNVRPIWVDSVRCRQPPVTLSSAALLTLKFKSFSLLFLKIILIIYLLDRFHTLRPSELCATQTHSFGFKTLLSVWKLKMLATDLLFQVRGDLMKNTWGCTMGKKNCGCGAWPILKTIKKLKKSVSWKSPNFILC